MTHPLLELITSITLKREKEDEAENTAYLKTAE